MALLSNLNHLSKDFSMKLSFFRAVAVGSLLAISSVAISSSAQAEVLCQRKGSPKVFSGSRCKSGYKLVKLNVNVSTIKGPSGPFGPKGDTGATGATGSVGATGPVGAKGDRGNAGLAGASGQTMAQLSVLCKSKRVEVSASSLTFNGEYGNATVYATCNEGYYLGAFNPEIQSSLGGGLQVSRETFSNTLNAEITPSEIYVQWYAIPLAEKSTAKLAIHGTCCPLNPATGVAVAPTFFLNAQQLP